MEKNQMKLLGIVCLVICVISIFVAAERYHTNAKNVRAMKQMMNNNSAPFGGMMRQMTGSANIKATTPAATKYALLFAAISGAGGGVLLVKSQADNVQEPQST
jgi:hypothetical protein